MARPLSDGYRAPGGAARYGSVCGWPESLLHCTPFAVQSGWPDDLGNGPRSEPWLGRDRPFPVGQLRSGTCVLIAPVGVVHKRAFVTLGHNSLLSDCLGVGHKGIVQFVRFRLLSHDALALLLCAVVPGGGCHHAKANGTIRTNWRESDSKGIWLRPHQPPQSLRAVGQRP